jgi:hypothetical protein
MAGIQSDAVASRTPRSFVRMRKPIKGHWDFLTNVRNLIDELESRKLDFEDIGTLENEDLPTQGEFFLTLTVRGDSGASVTSMGLENGRLFMLVSKDVHTSQLAVLDLHSETVGRAPLMSDKLSRL